MNAVMNSCIDSVEVTNVKQTQRIAGLAATIAMLAMILDGKTALNGAQEAVSMCFQAIIPSLFPFLVLSILQVNVLSSTPLPLLQPLRHIFGMKKGTEAILISGFLGGYPVGAQCVSSAYRAGYLQRDEAERMLAFCSNTGPAFLFGIVCTCFPDQRFTWLLWGIHILSAFLVSITVPSRSAYPTQLFIAHPFSLSDALRQALTTMATICGWVVLFRVIIAFFKRWVLWLFPAVYQTALIGILELTNGCFELQTVTSLPLRFVLCSCLLALGGSCVFMQTLSVTHGLSLRFYIVGKLLQTFYSLLLSSGIAYRSVHFTFPFLFLLLIIIRKIQKKCSIHDIIGV